MDLKTQAPVGVKWSNSSQIHLTIKFIGQFNPVDIEIIKDRLQKTLDQIPQFPLSIGKLGAFPELNKPRVIWLGINAKQTLLDVVQAVNIETEKLGYPSEKRPFSAHITLGRVRDHAKKEDLESIKSAILPHQHIEIGSERITHIYLIKSHLTPSGPVYEDLFKLPLIS